jgi:5-methylcytosine-specific restriction endonuclease McrA
LASTEAEKRAAARYYAKNKEKILTRNGQYQKRYYQENVSSILEYAAQYREKNRQQINAKAVASRQNHPDRYRSYDNKKRARKSRAKISDFTRWDWLELLVQYDGRCAYCWDRIAEHQEHKTPLSRGGDHTKSNIVPSCSICNLKKGTKTATEFIKAQLNA